jgi:hypothetical protein
VTVEFHRGNPWASVKRSQTTSAFTSIFAATLQDMAKGVLVCVNLVSFMGGVRTIAFALYDRLEARKFHAEFSLRKL